MPYRSIYRSDCAARRPHVRRRTIAGAAALAACLLTGCNSAGRQPDASANRGDNSAALDNATAASDQPPAQGPGKATPEQRQWLAQTTAFVGQPAQQRDIETALRARAATHPQACPAATFAPRHIDIAFDPTPQFAADGTMTRGTIIYRATMQGCTNPVLFTVYIDAMPGVPLRFRAGLAGTTFADPDLQERAIPHAIAAARPLLPGCTQIAPIDTRRIGALPSATGTMLPWSEYWLVAGCGRLVSTKLDFTPDHAANRMLVRADPAGSRMLRTGGATDAGAGASPGGAVGDDVALAQPASGAGKVVASAIGTSAIPLGGAPIPGAKVAGTCLFRLQETAPATAPDHVECLAGLPARMGATTLCSATRGVAKGQMTAAITSVDTASAQVKFQCSVRAQ